ncbi:hypothetical protein MXD63_45470, partial [Frankia sp. Cpl3]|nr:hypothetical protein [Frankia sp. Cpl3]
QVTERPSGRISIKLNGQQIEKKQEREENQQRKVFRQPEPFQANPLLTQEGPVETIEPIEENAMDRLLEMREKRKAAPVQTRPRR